MSSICETEGDCAFLYKHEGNLKCYLSLFGLVASRDHCSLTRAQQRNVYNALQECIYFFNPIDPESFGLCAFAFVEKFTKAIEEAE